MASREETHAKALDCTWVGKSDVIGGERQEREGGGVAHCVDQGSRLYIGTRWLVTEDMHSGRGKVAERGKEMKKGACLLIRSIPGISRVFRIAKKKHQFDLGYEITKKKSPPRQFPFQ